MPRYPFSIFSDLSQDGTQVTQKRDRIRRQYPVFITTAERPPDMPEPKRRPVGRRSVPGPPAGCIQHRLPYAKPSNTPTVIIKQRRSSIQDTPNMDIRTFRIGNNHIIEYARPPRWKTTLPRGMFQNRVHRFSRRKRPRFTFLHHPPLHLKKPDFRVYQKQYICQYGRG